ncbi:MAG: ABC transporter ATP-binding protein [Deltaproteobacteria bacterium]|jgi:branched-chain amino acid transport system ATP-binding protein|nr:ABC transporter ATP-binding protein [Deltaproteobacteria bacterium]
MSILRLRGLSKSFGGLVAVDEVSFEVSRGGIVGLIGPNGAGKTTVFNLITGNYKPDEGEVIFENKNITGLLPHKIVEMGIARTFQNIRLFPEMSALENVLSGCHCRMRSGLLASMFHLPGQRREEQAALETAVKELAFVGLEEQYDNLAKNLSYGRQRLLEIARALASGPRLLILDEPAGGMNDQETQDLIGLIREIRGTGISVLLIEHDMNLVMKICDYLIVLEYGAVIATGLPSEIKKNGRVIEAYLGADNLLEN